LPFVCLTESEKQLCCTDINSWLYPQILPFFRKETPLHLMCIFHSITLLLTFHFFIRLYWYLFKADIFCAQFIILNASKPVSEKMHLLYRQQAVNIILYSVVKEYRMKSNAKSKRFISAIGPVVNIAVCDAIRDFICAFNFNYMMLCRSSLLKLRFILNGCRWVNCFPQSLNKIPCSQLLTIQQCVSKVIKWKLKLWYVKCRICSQNNIEYPKADAE